MNSIDDILIFSSTRGTYGAFSNEYICNIIIEGKEYISIEHYFQAKKYETSDEELSEQIRNADTVEKAKLLGNDKEKVKLIRKDWHAVRLDFIFDALYLKFYYNPSLLKLLLSTKFKYICYNSVDNVWGSGLDEAGKNLLGKLLMEVRSKIQTEQMK